ncbi:MAG: NUDIX domain-containing protein [Mobiluncus sp.]|uniref:8-oxo-dGTP diphosphatase n=1 Tax=Mobiluncus porci TaxID=2652278 RepID=A0A7K0K3Q2_9ACTO|nr:NUDIX domain-containing protein [Mobiluncus sp.]MCI6585073.1 NUDIX domain-containing protein [Mobiluncus sp.]MST50111.1 NUDIX domain-containing protein [Mobiluncus porci]
MFTPIVVAAAIVDNLTEPKKILGAQRSYPEKWRGFFEFPGGKTEAGETPEEALRREILEELHAEIRIGRQLAGTWPAHGGYEMLVFLAEFAPGAKPQVGEAHLGLEWIEISNPQQLRWLPADGPILEAIVTHLKTPQ